MPLHPSSYLFLILLVVIVPLLAIRSALALRAMRREKRPLPTRKQFLLSVFATQGTFLLISLLVAMRGSIALFPPPKVTPATVWAAFLFLAIALGTLPIRYRWRSKQLSRSLTFRLPRRPADMLWWGPVSLAAGVVEEITYRGVMFQLLLRPLGIFGAIAVCVVAFGLAHAVKGWQAVVAIAILSIGFHLIVLVSGDLYAAIVVHFVYDLCAGPIMARLAQRDGLFDPEPEPVG